MIKKKVKQKVPAKPPPKTKYEDTKEFKVIDKMMRENRGVFSPLLRDAT